MSALAFLTLSLRWLMVPLAITICCLGNPQQYNPIHPTTRWLSMQLIALPCSSQQVNVSNINDR